MNKATIKCSLWVKCFRSEIKKVLMSLVCLLHTKCARETRSCFRRPIITFVVHLTVHLNAPASTLISTSVSVCVLDDCEHAVVGGWRSRLSLPLSSNNTGGITSLVEWKGRSSTVSDAIDGKGIAETSDNIKDATVTHTLPKVTSCVTYSNSFFFIKQPNNSFISLTM